MGAFISKTHRLNQTSKTDAQIAFDLHKCKENPFAVAKGFMQEKLIYGKANPTDRALTILCSAFASTATHNFLPA